ncbi:MAG: hypothetical protein M3228_00290 [Actinomycetota bacterium]|nr:hypothetical protein [Actinomycetota bacterium]
MKETATGHARRLHHVFGDVLPDSTADDRPDEEPDERDRWLRDNRPPHHDRLSQDPHPTTSVQGDGQGLG